MGAGSSAASRQLHHSVMMAGRHGGTSDLVRSAERVIQLNPRLIIDPDPDQGTTMLWEASRRGHKETLVILKLLSKHCTSKEEFLNCLDWLQRAWACVSAVQKLFPSHMEKHGSYGGFRGA